MSAESADPAGTPPPGDPRDLAAAEYVLGTMPAEEREDFARSLAADAGARAAVLAWERRLAPLGRTIPEQEPPKGLWERIASALPGRPANDNRTVALQRQVRRWRLAAGGAGALAAGLALFLATGWPREAERATRYLAVVTSSGAQPALIVSVDTRAGTAQVRPVQTETPDGRSLELWYVGTDKTPRTLGLLGTGANRVALPEGARTGEGVFAVSVEPKGGSPSGQPTGPVIYSGRLIQD